MTQQRPSNELQLEALSKSRMYRDYEGAFTVATGLPLRLVAPESLRAVASAAAAPTAFFEIAWKSAKDAASRARRGGAQIREPLHVTPYTGLVVSLVPVYTGKKLIAYLQTASIVLRERSRRGLERLLIALRKSGTKLDAEAESDIRRNSRVLAPKQYESIVQLLVLFADQLAACSNVLAVKTMGIEFAPITRACEFIHEHHQSDLSLAVVAKVAGMSDTYFSERFTQATGMHFTEFVARTRVEKARGLLNAVNMRISEVAFEVGFDSLSQFNRAFKRYAGQSPSEYRQSLQRTAG